MATLGMTVALSALHRRFLKLWRAENLIHMQGHATHFLDQLSRASGPQTELALELYYEPEVFKSVLRKAHVPHAYDRVAVSLHREDKGPYLVASHDGDFITCLGQGMDVCNAYLLRYFRLLSIMDAVPGCKERMEMAESLSVEGKNLTRLLDLVTSKGKSISREDFLAISAIQKSMKGHLARCWWQSGKDAVAVFNKLALSRRKQKGFRNKNHNDLRLYWNLFHGVGHFSLLFSMSGIAEIESIIESNKEGCRALYGYLAYKDDLSIFTKLAWSLSRMGDFGYNTCRSFFLEPYGGPIWLLGVVGLSVIALFNRERSREIKELFESTCTIFYIYDKSVFDGFGSRAAKELLTKAIDLLDNPDRSRSDTTILLPNKFMFEYSRRSELPPRYNWDRPSHIPEDISNAFMINAGLPFLDERIIPALMDLVPWMSRCEPQDFYLTADFAKHVDLSFTPKAAEMLIDQQQDGTTRCTDTQSEAPPRPGRNEACTCGSGKKYKRCCS